MGLFNERSWTYIWTELVFVYLGTVFCAVVIAKHLHQVQQDKKRKALKKSKKPAKQKTFDDLVIYYGTILSVFLFAVQLPMRAFWRTAELGGYSSKSCYSLAICTALLWVFSKLSMFCFFSLGIYCPHCSVPISFNRYTVFVARAEVSFRGTTMAYHSTTIRGLYAVLAVHAVIMVILLAVFGDGRKGYASRKRNGNKKGGREDGMPICLAEHALLVLYYAAGTDFIFTGLLVYLFVNPLMKMFGLRTAGARRPSGSRRAIRELETQLLPVKSMLLSSIAVCSTAFALLFSAITAMAFVVYLDLCVNLSCLLLVTKQWSATYWFVCGPLLRCMARSESCFAADPRESLRVVLNYHAQKRKGIDGGDGAPVEEKHGAQMSDVVDVTK